MPTPFDATKTAWLAELRKQKQWAEHALAQLPDDKLHAPIAAVRMTNRIATM